MDKVKRFLPAVLIIVASLIFLQSLFFKFTGAEDTVQIFGLIELTARTVLGIEGLFVGGLFSAYVIGSVELITAVLLLAGLFLGHKLLQTLGALLGLGVISGAIFFHLFTDLGVNVPFASSGCPVIDLDGLGGPASREAILATAGCQPDPSLFVMACVVWLSCVGLLTLNRARLARLLGRKQAAASI